MFCPECRAEYREGFTECADCQVALVNELPPEPTEKIPEFVDMETVFVTKDPGEVALIKSILEAENIPFFVQGDHFSSLYGYLIPVRFLVPRDRAKEIKLALSFLL